MTTTLTIGPSHTWAVILAGGDGRRLSTLTTVDGSHSVPKQFCTINGRSSLLDDALRRAQRIVPRSRVCVVVAQQHELYWRMTSGRIPPANVFTEPQNRGTGIGILHAALRIMDRDPHARIVFLPADHHVRHERRLARSVRAAVRSLGRAGREVLLVGMTPTNPAPDLGYIVPTQQTAGARGVEQFVEKPGVPLARDLITRGAVWNTFIFAAPAQSLLEALRMRISAIASDLSAALLHDRQRNRAVSAMTAVYARLPSVDFSADILQQSLTRLRVVTAPACGWVDVGSLQRVSTIVPQYRHVSRVQSRGRRKPPGAQLIDLVAQYTRQSRAIY